MIDILKKNEITEIKKSVEIVKTWDTKNLKSHIGMKELDR